jgi:hypothetical protein
VQPSAPSPPDHINVLLQFWPGGTSTDDGGVDSGGIGFARYQSNLEGNYEACISGRHGLLPEARALRKSDAPDQTEPKMECRDFKHIFGKLLPAQMAEQTESPYFGQITSHHI